MRLRRAVLALALLAACSDDDDGAVTASGSGSASDVEAESTDDEATVDDEELASGDVQALIDGAQLDAEDLGEGYELTATSPPDDQDDEDDEDDTDAGEANPIEDCLAGDLDDRFDEATVAETDERTFTQTGGAPVPAEVTASNVALDDEALFDEMHELLRSEDFATCMGDAFEAVLAESAAGADIALGDIAVAEDAVEADVDDLTSTTITIPVTVSAEGFSLEADVSMLFLDVGELGSSILVFGAADEGRGDDLVRWGGLVAERLAG